MVRAGLILALLVLAARAAHLSLNSASTAGVAIDQIVAELRIQAQRGAIVDRSGAVLALSVDAPSLYVAPSSTAEGRAAARALAPILGRSPAALARRIGDRPHFVFLGRWISADQARRVTELDLDGVGLVPEPRRVYPHKRMSASVVGFANIEGKGVRGIEQQENTWLSGTARRLIAERDGAGVRLVAAGQSDPANSDGGDVALTLDAALQAHAEASLAEAVARTGALGGVVISMAVGSGDILALAEAPGFDPNGFRDLDYYSTRSRAFLDSIEPGSTLKLFTVAGALDANAVGIDQIVDCENGTFRLPGKTLHDARPHGGLSTGDVLRVSSNIGAAKIGFLLGPGAHHAMLHDFGFGRPTLSRFPDESAGILRPWQNWTQIDHATISFGQGIGVTSIQLVAAVAAIANGGVWMQPRLVGARRAPGHDWEIHTPDPGRRVVRPETAAQVLALLERTVASDGTGRRAALRDVRVAGKTGTAQKYDPETGRYANDRFRAWFVGAVPANDPKIVILVGLDEPKRPRHTGGAAAAPLFARVAAEHLSRFGIFTVAQPLPPAPRPAATLTARRAPAPPADVKAAAATPPPVSAPPQPVAVRPAEASPPPTPPLARLENRILLPDFRGLTLAEVKRIAAAGSLKLEVSGEGVAVGQDPPPGTVVPAHEGRVSVRFASRAGVAGERG
jgi:cell division protein FtsI (penicillin-binding protein 3)